MNFLTALSDWWLGLFIWIGDVDLSFNSQIRLLLVAVILAEVVAVEPLGRRHINFPFLGADPRLPDHFVCFTFLHVVVFNQLLRNLVDSPVLCIILIVSKRAQTRVHQRGRLHVSTLSVLLILVIIYLLVPTHRFSPGLGWLHGRSRNYLLVCSFGLVGRTYYRGLFTWH